MSSEHQPEFVERHVDLENTQIPKGMTVQVNSTDVSNVAWDNIKQQVTNWWLVELSVRFSGTFFREGWNVAVSHSEQYIS